MVRGLSLVLIASLPIFLIAGFLLADETAYTEGGIKVILKPDGTWILAPKETRQHRKTVAGFRGIKWGSSKADVKRQEKAKLLTEDKRRLKYSTTLDELDCLAVYQFARDTLTVAAYFITEEHSNENDYISDYADLKQVLRDKYGTPQENEVSWKNSLYRNDREDWGRAISYGHLVYYTKWETEKTDITLILDGDNRQIRLAIRYDGKKFAHIEKSEKEKRALRDF